MHHIILDLIKGKLRRHPGLMRLVRLVIRHIRVHTNAYPRWSDVVGIQDDSAPETGKKILIATSVGSHLPGTTLESFLSVALRTRGAQVHIFLCDGVLPACLGCEYDWFPDTSKFSRTGPQPKLCGTCFNPANEMYSRLGLKVHRYSDYLSEINRQSIESICNETQDEIIPDFILDGMSIGEHAKAGALRFFAKASLDDEPDGVAVLRRYFKAALMTAFATRNLLANTAFDAAVFHHGIYVPQGLISEVARKAGIRVVTWNPAYRKQSFIFSHDDTYHHTLMSEPVDKWQNMAWPSELEADLMTYLQSRWHGTGDWIWFHDRPNFDVDKISSDLGLDKSMPCIGMLTNVMWDAQLHYPANAFPDMLAWVLETIDYFSGRQDLQLLIRVHPAEIRGTLPSRQPIVEEIAKKFPKLPDNVFVVPPESDISTYSLMGLCDSVLIYGTKMGVELTSMGMPTIVAGEAWVRNKGITIDAASREDYFSILDRLPMRKKMDESQIQRARKYAFHFFFRRMVPIEFMVPSNGWPPFKMDLKDIDQLRPGVSKGLDVICEGILEGKDFIYPAEQLMSTNVTM